MEGSGSKSQISLKWPIYDSSFSFYKKRVKFAWPLVASVSPLHQPLLICVTKILLSLTCEVPGKILIGNQDDERMPRGMHQHISCWSEDELLIWRLSLWERWVGAGTSAWVYDCFCWFGYSGRTLKVLFCLLLLLDLNIREYFAA